MKFIINSVELYKNLQSIGGVLSTNNTLPILNDFFFQLKDGYLKITASDMETTMSVSLPLENADEDGSICIPAKILLDSLKVFPNVPLHVSANDDTFNVELSTGEGRYKLSGHDGNLYPQFPEPETTGSITLAAELFASAINYTLFAAGVDEMRPVMSGVCFEFKTDSITFVATDAHKLVRYRRTDIKADKDDNLILPRKPLNQLKNILIAKDTDVLIEFNSKNASFTIDNIKLSCRLIDGKYPNYEAVIPLNNPNKLTVDRQQLLNAIKRVAIFASQSTHQVRLQMTGQELYVSAEDIDYSNEAKERMTSSYEGEDLEIGFNSRFLQEMLSNLTCLEICLETSEPSRAGLIFPVSTEETNEEVLMLIMPVMLPQ